MAANRFKRNGYFVEFGATNGIGLNNTYLLETKYSWNGILAEPCQIWHEDLFKNRSCHIDTNCIWAVSGEQLEFDIAEERELSTISTFSALDKHGEKRRNSTKDIVTTLSLVELLAKYSAPTKIDYLSVDTEGSEFEILSNFDFERYSFNFISVEHNYTEKRNAIFELLTTHGYERVLEQYSGFDDWYVLNT
ncbi:FkbM family methyltransferase [Labrenzia sp. EL_208]|nr:FkbM family methyltransferase [Labrenzia sp. EL_132]MBG6229531.1 FkbM family methyltransferase [Labrenzia sp. EL_208]